jgi:hypothetical protein
MNHTLKKYMLLVVIGVMWNILDLYDVIIIKFNEC